MPFISKHFNDLTTQELFAIYKLRVSIFVVEQHCPYQEVDDFDTVAYHIWLEDEEGIQAYLRVLPKGTTFDEVSIGRVISMKRRSGLGTQIVQKGIEEAQKRFGAKKIIIEAQVYAKSLYEKLGFVTTSEEFLEDGIPHVQMTWTKEETVC